MATRHLLLLMVFSCCMCALPMELTAQTSWLRTTDYAVAAPSWIESSVMYDSVRAAYAMWYVDNAKNIIGRAISFDGNSWFVSDTVALAAGSGGEFDSRIHAVDVIYNGQEYLMYYTASRSSDTLVIAAARSTDGIRWTKIGQGPVLRPKVNAWDSRHVGGAKVRLEQGGFSMWYGGSDGTYLNTGLATSMDGIAWTRYSSDPVLPRGGPGSFDEREAGVMGVTEKQGKLYMLYRAYTKGGTPTFALATSFDGIHWWKYPQNPVMARTSWDWNIGSGTLLWRAPWFRFWYSSAPYDAPSRWTIRTAVSEAVTLSSDDVAPPIPAAAFLAQNFPNPFNPTTVIHFQLPREDHVSLAVYDLLGRRVADLINERKTAGEHSVAFNGSRLGSGVYFYRLQAGEFVSTRRMTLVR